EPRFLPERYEVEPPLLTAWLSSKTVIQLPPSKGSDFLRNEEEGLGVAFRRNSPFHENNGVKIMEEQSEKNYTGNHVTLGDFWSLKFLVDNSFLLGYAYKNEEYEDSDSSSEYDNAPFPTRWYSANRGFLCYRENSKSIEVEFFDGFTHWIGSKNEFSDLSRDWFFIHVDKNETLKEAHKRYTNESIAISQKSHGLIDMRKIGTYAATSLHLFHDVTKGLVISKRLSQEEEHWISKASIGSIIWAEPYEGNAKQYDVNEFYPSVLLQKEAKWPTCLYMQGECDQLLKQILNDKTAGAKDTLHAFAFCPSVHASVMDHIFVPTR
ncbi:7600_t:CDS:2, partial [Rhizophagus irregularis]